MKPNKTFLAAPLIAVLLLGVQAHGSYPCTVSLRGVFNKSASIKVGEGEPETRGNALMFLRRVRELVEGQTCTFNFAQVRQVATDLLSGLDQGKIRWANDEVNNIMAIQDKQINSSQADTRAGDVFKLYRDKYCSQWPEKNRESCQKSTDFRGIGEALQKIESAAARELKRTELDAFIAGTRTCRGGTSAAPSSPAPAR